MMLIKHITLFLFLMLPYFIKSQCSISVSSTPEPVMCGGCVTLSAFGSGVGNIAFQEDFNTGSPTGWNFTQTADYSNPCSPAGVDGTPHLWMGNASVNPRDIETVAMDLTLGGTICFDMLFATQGNASPCEGPDEPDEGVFLQYSNDGGVTWITINYFDPNGGNDPQLTNWNNYCFALPLGALTTSTMIRWHQNDVTGAQYDHWGIDNVVITLNDPNYEVSWLHDGYAYGLGNGGGANPTQVCLTNDSTFTAQVTDGTNTCTASVTVTVSLPDVQVSAGTDTMVCLGECVNLNGFATVIVSPASTPTFTNQETNVISGTPLLPSVPCLSFGGCTCWDGSTVAIGGTCPDEPGLINASMNINIQNLNTTSVFTGFITNVCLSNFTINPGFGCTATSLTDVEVVLICPGGTEVVLATLGTLAGGTITNMCFQPGGVNYTTASAPYSGTFNPANSWTTLNGCPVSGNWTLEIRGPNYETCIPVGAVDGWSITFDDPEISYTPSVTWSPTTNMTNSTSLTPNVCVSGNTTYTITASDTAGCVTASAPVTISIAPTCCQLQLDSTTLVNPSCGQANGSITIYTSGNQGIVNYSIDNGISFQTNSLFSTLSSGVYDIVIQDDSCTVTQQVTLTDLPGPSILQVNTTDPTCGNADGTIDIQATGGNGTLNYSIDNGVLFQTGTSFSGLVSGSYNIVVEDSLACQTTATISLNNSLAPIIDSVSSVNPSCGLLNGQLDINVSGGTGIINYSIDNGVTFQSGNSIFTALSPGNYAIVVQDANGCLANSQVTLTSSQGVVIDVITITNPSCGVQNGTVNIQVSGGGTPYSYSIDNGVTTQANSVFNGLGAATYTVYVQDNNGCFVDSLITLNSAGGPIIDTVIVSDPSCSTSDGSISITASGGNGTLSYSINNGVSFQNGTTFSSLPSGNYTVVVQDANLCATNLPVSLNNFPGPTIDSVNTTDPSCGNSDGIIEIFASGTPSLLYSIDNGVSFSNTSVFSTLNIGTYDIVVVDGNSCQAAQQVMLNNTTAPSIDNLVVINPTCGLNNGEIDVFASGAPTLLFSINGGTLGTTSVFSSLGAGVYDLLVEDGNGCQTGIQQTIVFSSGPTIDSVSTINPTCFGDVDGSALVYVSGGTPNYTYSIDNGITVQGGNSYNSLANGNYSVLVTDQNNCTINSIFNITEPPVLTTGFSSVNASCFGICDGAIQVSATGGITTSGGYNYNWSNGIAGPTQAQANSVCAGAYTLTITDDNGCNVDTNFTITEPAEVIITSVATQDEVCFNDCQGTLTVSSPTATSYSIDGGLNYVTSPLFDSLCPGSYIVNIMDVNGCFASNIVQVNAANELIPDFILDSVTITTFNSTVNFTNTSAGGVNFDWNFGGAGVSNDENPTFTFPEGVADNYTVCLTIINANSCRASTCHIVIVQPEFFFYVPNTFTPDGDGINESFFADGLGLSEWNFDLMIFNRWGELIFRTNDPLDKWDGTYKGVNAVEDIYIWKIKIEHPDFIEDQIYTGHVNLIR